MTARLLIITDGKTQKAAEVEYKWDKWESSAAAATGQLVLLIQDGEPFGVKGKRLPLLALALQNAPAHTWAVMPTALALEGKLSGLKFAGSSYSTPLGRNAILYAQLEAAKLDAPPSLSVGSNLESLIAASKGGHRILAIQLESTLQE